MIHDDSNPLLFQSDRYKIKRAITKLSGLTVYYPFNETSGSIAFNQAPSTKGTLNATIVGATPGIEAPVGRGFGFDGVNDEVTGGNIVGLTDRITFFCIARLNSTTFTGGNFSNFPTLTSKTGNAGYFFLWNPSRQMSFNFNSSGGEKNSGVTSAAWALGAWYFVVGRYDKDGGSNNLKIDLFGNGAHVANSSTQTLAMIPGTGGLCFAHDTNRGYFMNVSGQHWGVVSRSITDGEMNNIAKIGGFTI